MIKPNSEDHAAALQLQRQIKHCLDHQRQLTRQIEQLARLRITSEKKESELRKELRAVFTMPLNFGK
jgi:ferritin